MCARLHGGKAALAAVPYTGDFPVLPTEIGLIEKGMEKCWSPINKTQVFQLIR